MVADNIIVFNRSINGSLETAGHLLFGRKAWHSTIFVKLHDSHFIKFMKTDGGELKEYAPITAITKVVRYSCNDRMVRFEQRQYPLVLAPTFTIHKSHRSTLEYIAGDWYRTINLGPNAAVVDKCQFYMFLSCVPIRDSVKLLIFDLCLIRCNEQSLAQME